MSNEKQTEHFHWISRLDGLESLPGETMLNKSEAWEKLHLRLQYKPSRKKTSWYWAAACLLAASLAPLVWTKPATPVVKSDGQPVLPIKHHEETTTPPVITNVNALPIASSTPNKPIIIQKRIAPAVSKFRNNHTIAAITAHTKNQLVPLQPGALPVAQIVAPATNDNFAPPVLITKKKLRVVYINQLEKMQPQSNDQFAAGNSGPRNLRFNVGSSVSLPETTTGQPGAAAQLKIPLHN